VFPCHKEGAEWVDAINKAHGDIQPTHWRNWTGALNRNPEHRGHGE
jgi:hypothetical protein